MAAATQASTPSSGRREPNHGLRIFLIWLVIALTTDLLLWFVFGPHMPPGKLSNQAEGQQFDLNVMAIMAAPVTVFVLVYLAYSVTVWRRRPGDDGEGPAIQGNTRVQATWITLSTVIVMGLFAFGTYELIAPAGAGGGEGPAPIWRPAGAELTAAQQTVPWTPGKPVVIQVVGQQWRFTYRYPQFGGFETTELRVPLGQWVQFDVTSIDVIHSFWAYQLGVKADANPGVDNVAYTKPQQLGSITVRCGELCGLWHGAMFNYGKVMTLAQFQAWTASTSASLASVTRLLPSYATTYDPSAISTLGAVLSKAPPNGLGLGGAGGGYYPGADPEQP